MIGRILISFAREAAVDFFWIRQEIDDPLLESTEELGSLDVKPLSVLFRLAYFFF
jgi:hypothetical protein